VSEDSGEETLNEVRVVAESKKFKCCIEEYDFLSVHLHREDKEVFITTNNEIDDSAGVSVCLEKQQLSDLIGFLIHCLDVIY
jgi:hypothetical protein